MIMATVMSRAVLWTVLSAALLMQPFNIFTSAQPGISDDRSPGIFNDMDSSGDVTDDYAGALQGSGDDPVPSIDSLVEAEINIETVRTVVNETKRALAETRDLGVQEVMRAVTIIERTAEVPSIPAQTAQDVLEIVDTLSGLNVTGVNETDTVGNFTNRLIRSVEELGRKVDLDSASSARLVSTTTAVEVWDVSRVSDDEDFPLGLYLKVVEAEEEEEKDDDVEEADPADMLNSDDLVTVLEDKEVVPKDTDVAVTLPSSFLRSIIDDNPGKEVRLWMTVFSDTSLFEADKAQTVDPLVPEARKNMSQPRGRLNSKVISASVSANGEPVLRFPSSVVTSVFLPVIKVPEDRRAQLSRCVFWDMRGQEGRGAWSGQGCRYQKTLHNRDVCVCDHLTNFAVLLDFYGQSEQPSKGHQVALGFLSTVGLSFSICGLACTILTFICIRKMHHLLPKQVLFNLALAMLVSWVIFLAGFSGAAGSHVGCIAVAALLHYFILATFFWMLAEAVMQYLLLVKVHGQVRRFLLKAALAAWGIPVIPVLTILAVDLNLYKGYDNYCWMSLMPLYFAFLLPVGLVMLCNLVIYVLVVVSICRVRGRAKPGAANRGRGVSVRASFACFVVLGLSWLFAFLAVEDARLVFQYLFTATTTFQGLLIFLVFTARDPLVQEFCRDKIRQGMALVRSSGRTQTGSSTLGGREEGGVHMESQLSRRKAGAGGSSDIPLRSL